MSFEEHLITERRESFCHCLDKVKSCPFAIVSSLKLVEEPLEGATKSLKLAD